MSFAPLLLAALLAAGPDAPVARVGGEPITRAAVALRVEGAARNGQTWTPAQALESLLNDAVLAAEARRMGIAASEVAPFVEREVRRAAAVALVESYAAKRDPDEATLRRMFHSSADFVSFEFLAYGSEAQARAARARVEKGGSFEAEAGGAVASRLRAAADASPVMRAQLNEAFAAALFAAAPNGLVGPVETDRGWMVARVVKKIVGTDAEYAQRRPVLLLQVRKQTREAARTHLADQLRAKAGVTIDEAFLRSLKGAEASPADLQHVVATVAGKPVRYADVYPRVASLGGQAGHMASPAVKIGLAHAVVNERLIEAFAIERGFDKSPEVAAMRADFEQNGLAALAAERIRAAAPRPSKQEVEAHYERNRARYQRPLGEVRRAVEAELADQKREDHLARRVAELRAAAGISVDERELARAAR